MTADEQRWYLLDDKEKAKEKDEMTDPADNYDSDLNRTLFQEFWTDLSQFKKKPKIRGKSVARGSSQGTGTSISVGGPIKSQPSFRIGQRNNSIMTYQSTPKGIAGTLQASIEDQAFAIKIKDPMSPMNKEINPQFIQPKVQFDSIFDEYLAKQKQFDHLRQGQAANQKSGDVAKNETLILKNKLAQVQKVQEIELRHAKETAQREADELLKTKLQQARDCYIEELEHIIQQYEELQKEVGVLKQDKIKLKRTITRLEQIITD